MSPDGDNPGSFEERIRAIADEVGRSLEDFTAQMNVEGAAQLFGIDPSVARERFEEASQWLRDRAESVGDEMTSGRPRPAGAGRPTGGTPPAGGVSAEDPLGRAGPHPLDVPSDEQGLALAALDSGRWTIEPGSNALAARGEGPGPSDALGLVRELRVRDWLTAEGEVTVVGRHALTRWLESSRPR
jgi:hypothetical protein